MPVFEYQCERCGRLFDIFMQRREDAAEVACPSCGEKDVRRMLSTFASQASAGRCAPIGGG